MAEQHESQAHGSGHPQVHIQVDDREADVDEELAPLITEIWSFGMDTIMSCQQHDTPEFAEHGMPTAWVWLDFATPDDASTFCDIVAGTYDPDPESLFQRVAGSPDQESKRHWWYDIHAMDYGEEEPGKQADVGFDVSVRFPREDLPEAFQRVRAKNEEYELHIREMEQRERRDRAGSEQDGELPSWLPESFSEFLKEQTGLEVSPEVVKAVTVNRIAFRQSEFYRRAKAEAEAG